MGSPGPIRAVGVLGEEERRGRKVDALLLRVIL